jgi:hypothetical protein
LALQLGEGEKLYGKPLPLTLLRMINPCHLHDTNEMSLPDDTDETLAKHGVHFATLLLKVTIRGHLNSPRRPYDYFMAVFVVFQLWRKAICQKAYENLSF